MAKHQGWQTDCISIEQRKHTFFLTKLPADILTRISYVAVRRPKEEEEGAVQRMLNPSRIDSIKSFVLRGGAFPNALVLNWVSKDNPITFDGKGTLSFEIAERLAQIIDGQHRIAGIRAAIADDKSISQLQLPVAIYSGLATAECADLFLSINTEQKPVPKSLVFDLYGIASAGSIDSAALRARDISMFLNDEPESPYHTELKLPGAPTRRGGIALSTAVSTIKPLVEEKGTFEQLGVDELESQQIIIFNLFKTLQNIYGEQWWERTNAFMYAAGFSGAIEFLRARLIEYCTMRRSFTIPTMKEAILLQPDSLILQSEVKGLGGTAAAKAVFDRLNSAFQLSHTDRKLDIR